MLGALQSDFKRLFTSPKFWGSIFGTALIYLLNASCLGADAFHDFASLLDASAAPFFQLVVLIFAALPFGTVFCEDWDNRYIRCAVMRTSLKKYLASKFISCFIGALCVGALGMLLMLVVSIPFLQDLTFSQQNPMIVVAIQNPTGINWLAAHGWMPVWVIFISVIRSFLGCIYAGLALLVSTKITNTFVTLAMPVIGYAIYQNVISFINIPDFLRSNFLSQNIDFSVGYTVIAFILTFAVCFIFLALFYRSARRKLANE